MHIVTVRFQILPAHREEFMLAMTANASESLQRETGCRQFDVCVAQDDMNQVLLYEVYDTPEDFEIHLKMPHFLVFNQATAAWVASKQVNVYRRR